MTYSIIARDSDSGAFGVAVQSHYFSVGSAVTWARPGFGAVATQSLALVSYGPRGLDLMGAGRSASEALAELVAEDEGAESRQVAMIDREGRVAAHTGTDCIVHAGHVLGDGVSCQANIMVTPEIWGAMLAAYEAARLAGEPLARRLLAALNAAEALGGDARGRQSAALLVVPGTGEVWERDVELRVEDHPEPLEELARLLDVHDAYRLASAADDELVAGRPEAAGTLFAQSLELLPESHELKFWTGLSLAHAGETERGQALVEAAIAAQPGWRWLLPRLRDETIPGASAMAQRLGLSAGE